ncbi:MAG TPA: flagellar protein FlgN [Negativicutes bacterium]|nr:flagellar protein FlgN [Negativicutes bacterium]
MQQYAASFVTLLSDFITVYQNLASLAKEKTNILVQGDVQKLDALLTQETELLIGAGKLEKQRAGLIAEWGRAAGWTTGEITTQSIMSQIEESSRTAMEGKVRELKRVLDEIRALNKTNSELIEQSLQFVNYSLELMSGPDVGGMTYGANGALGDRQGYKILDQKV